jgi:hypothetical protein
MERTLEDFNLHLSNPATSINPLDYSVCNYYNGSDLRYWINSAAILVQKTMS